MTKAEIESTHISLGECACGEGHGKCAAHQMIVEAIQKAWDDGFKEGTFRYLKSSDPRWKDK